MAILDANKRVIKGMQFKTIRICLSVGYLWLAFSLAATAATTTSVNPEDVVFRVGSFDRGLLQFAFEAPSGSANFAVGGNQTAKDWYGTQSAVEAGALETAGSNKTPSRTISFSLSGTPAPTYRLRMALLSINARIPQLRICINSKQGTFYLHPDDSRGEFAFSTSNQDLEFDFPGTYLHAGTNRITLQAIASADQSTMDVQLTYGAIEMDRIGKSRKGNVSSAQIEPTIFYPRGAGAPQEVVDVFVQYREPVHAGSPVKLTVCRFQTGCRIKSRH